MRLLLDTHAFVWFLAGDKRLSHKARRTIEDGRNTVLASPAVAYELAYKRDFGTVEDMLVSQFAEGVRRGRFEELPIMIDDAVAAAELPELHKDPWDRLLIAQAKRGGLLMVTHDAMFEAYGLKTLW